MKRMKLLTSLVLSGSMIFGMASYALADDDKREKSKPREVVSFEFEDSTDAAWAQVYIGKMQALDVIKGYTDGTFKPNKPVTQIEAITMAVRLMGLEEEAKAKPAQVPLHFKDEKEVPSWARGYVAVALENGLFDADDDKVQPQKAASRVWIVELLVKALGMEQEALAQMSDIPDFQDVDAIPAGAIGYVNAAVDLGITTGYPDRTFGPNKPVTRGEMATFLYRTHDEQLEHAGATIVQGKIQSVYFDDTVTDDVYSDIKGMITVESYDGQLLVFRIDADVLVEYYDRFITADQLIAGDVITLIAQNGVVVDAALVTEQTGEHQAGDSIQKRQIIEFEVELEADDQEWKLKYKNKNGKAEASYESKQGRDKVRLTGAEAVKVIERFITDSGITSDMNKEEITAAVLKVLSIDKAKVEEIEIEIRYANGSKVKIEIDQDDRDREGKDHDGRPDQDGHHGQKDDDRKGKSEGNHHKESTKSNQSIVAFKVEMELDDDVEASWEYQLKKNGKPEAEIKLESDKGKGKAKNTNKLKGQKAIEQMEKIIGQLSLTNDMSEDERIAEVVRVLGIDASHIEELELEIRYADGSHIKIELDDRDDDEEDDD